MHPDFFISIDWGTSNFRMRLVESASFHVVEEKVEAVGIKALHGQWQAGGGDRETRLVRFLEAQRRGFRHPVTAGTTAVISGMASSDIGLRELPYRPLPVPLEAAGLTVVPLRYAASDLDIRLISGLCTTEDIMRGEETQLIGLAGHIDPDEKTVVVLPGTHSKHVRCHRGFIETFCTFLSGEMFELLTRHSMLAGSVRRTGWTEAMRDAFEDGVDEATRGEALLRSVFRVRAWDRLALRSPGENYYYLSGLIIGSELNALAQEPAERILVAAAAGLDILYRTAGERLGLGGKTTFLPEGSLETALLRAHGAVAAMDC